MRNLTAEQALSNYLDASDELHAKISQASALIEYLSVDLCENNSQNFTPSIEIVGGMLWTISDLLTSSKVKYEELSEAVTQYRKAIKGGENV
ncbi:hypothetical protein A4G19_15475 [Pasteurellaceae bacterium Macca]|nr:hypothetical protein [Pasteurellaceae bacterium Macca]MCK3656003.1 hypothetical protein [Pasteurellaceae bacterium Macca]MCK3656104.1 hypothetical protein [Pasteurellaceae bacterium Macca]MCK3656125.1 hypothetical protein [Pasteurellaceae bacterium Macca]MCK3656143.1 hypothetical protein [Pasteurellaceae bacterium Macca]